MIMKQTFTKFIMLLIAITLSMGLMAADQVVTRTEIPVQERYDKQLLMPAMAMR